MKGNPAEFNAARVFECARWRARTVATLRSRSQRPIQHEREGEVLNHIKHSRHVSDELMDSCLAFAVLAVLSMNCFSGSLVGLVH